MDRCRVETCAGTLVLRSEDANGWRFAVSKKAAVVGGGVEIVHVELRADVPIVPPEFSVELCLPQNDVQHRWTPSLRNPGVPPTWASEMESLLTVDMPLTVLMNQQGANRLCVAASEAGRRVKIISGIQEQDCMTRVQFVFFSLPEAPLDAYDVFIRIDRRAVAFSDAVRDVSLWFEGFPAYRPCVPPAEAYEPIYSTWYNYHQNVFAGEIEAECALAAELGMKSVIVDDGWQTDDARGGYAFCGDWELSTRRFPDMRAHVARIHDLGMKYILWYSVPFVGYRSKVVERFRGKYLVDVPRLSTYVLDPRFPEVRDYLVGIYEKALLDWDLDGFKLDFIDRFRSPDPDPAVAENYAGRDIRTVAEAADVLLSEVMRRLRKIKPDVLVEFRQSYIGPAIRKYGNMFRAGDCPADVIQNRIRTVNLRLTSGRTAVHGDMLEWNGTETAECAALQILNVIFSVIQFSVVLRSLSAEHMRMVKFWLDFCRTHRAALLHGDFKPEHPELNYPVVTAGNDSECITAVYGACVVVPVGGDRGKTYHIVNATDEDGVVLELFGEPHRVELHDTCGGVVTPPRLGAGLSRIRMPKSGLLTLVF